MLILITFIYYDYYVLTKNWADIGVKQIIDNDQQISKCIEIQSVCPVEVSGDN